MALSPGSQKDGSLGFERLSSLQETGGELEPVRVTLTRWLALDRLSEEAYRRLMRALSLTLFF